MWHVSSIWVLPARRASSPALSASSLSVQHPPPPACPHIPRSCTQHPYGGPVLTSSSLYPPSHPGTQPSIPESSCVLATLLPAGAEATSLPLLPLSHKPSGPARPPQDPHSGKVLPRWSLPSQNYLPPTSLQPASPLQPLPRPAF